MGILERTRHVVRADLNALVRKARNPEAVLDAYLDDLHTVLEEAESLRAAEEAERQIYRSRLRDIQAAQSKWEKKARVCLSQGQEALARSALEHKLDLAPEAAAVERELAHREAGLAVLDDSIEALRQRIAEVDRKMRELRYRRQALQARSELQAAMGKLHSDQDDPILAEAEDRLIAMESEVEANESLAALSADGRALKLEAAERRRRRQEEIDDQLEALRREIERGDA